MIQHLLGSDRTPNILFAALDGYSARHDAIVNNIANVDTPGYHRIEVEFEKQLQREVAKMSPRRDPDGSVSFGDDEASLGSFSPRARVDTSAPVRFDGSNVRIDREMVDLAKTTGKINELTELLIRKQRQTRSAIIGRVV